MRIFKKLCVVVTFQSGKQGMTPYLVPLSLPQLHFELMTSLTLFRVCVLGEGGNKDIVMKFWNFVFLSLSPQQTSNKEIEKIFLRILFCTFTDSVTIAIFIFRPNLLIH
jgi:hypothetical protein